MFGEILLLDTVAAEAPRRGFTNGIFTKIIIIINLKIIQKQWLGYARLLVL
jgi:hypothetical protein